jgi:CubicO group peptidase (beta-lactamase class C family)
MSIGREQRVVARVACALFAGLTLALSAMAAGGAALDAGAAWAPSQAPAPVQKKPALSVEARVDRIFERFDRDGTPGCVVGVAVEGKPVLVRAYGMADLERGVKLRPDTVFESGSVAKQFTAAAVALLCQDGKLSLDDPVRRYVPELPDFGTPILIRHLLNHTSGLRSQWALLSLAGRPPGRVMHTIAEILALVARMRELNFEPGEEFLYCNTGYTLLGVIVARVSGKSLDAFCRERLFGPLGMTRTRWRDDFALIVPGRASAYGRRNDGTFYLNLPFTEVIGNGGLLTTAGDLLIWNEHLDNPTPSAGGRALVDQIETRGRLNDGFENEYAQGLYVGKYKGLREVSHGGSTAGYHAFLARYPEARLSIVVLSNLAGAMPNRLGREVADIYLAGKLGKPERLVVMPVAAETLRKFAGIYREPLTDAALRIEMDKDGKTLRIGRQQVYALSATEFITADGSRRLTFEAELPGSPLRMRESDGRNKPRMWEAVPAFAPGPAELEAYVGDYRSEEIDTTYSVYIESGKLYARYRPAWRFQMIPVYEDAFEDGGDVFRFTRDGSGEVDGLRVYADRVRHLRFVRVGPLDN